MKFKVGDDLSYYLGPDAKTATTKQCDELARIFADADGEIQMPDQAPDTDVELGKGMKIGDTVIWGNYPDVHTWCVRGIHLGAVGIESLIELENVSHKPGWTGGWMTHQMMFVPECLMRQCRIGNAVDADS